MKYCSKCCEPIVGNSNQAANHIDNIFCEVCKRKWFAYFEKNKHSGRENLYSEFLRIPDDKEKVIFT